MLQSQSSQRVPFLSETYAWNEHCFDEWKSYQGPGDLWAPLFAELDRIGKTGLNSLRQQSDDLLRDNGIEYSSNEDALQSQHGDLLDPIPLFLAESEFQTLSQAVIQRADLLNSAIREIYSSKNLVRDGVVPPSLIYSQESFNRALCGCLPKGANYLNNYAVELTRDAHGAWHVTRDFTQAPAGLGITLESRLITTSLFSDLASKQNLIRVAGFYQSYRDTIYAQAPAGVDEPLIVILSSKVPGSSYTEDVFLSQYLGITLVEGSELTVRNDRVYLKTVSGLIRVHVIIRKIEEKEADPLFNPVDTYGGVPGLMQVIRTGNVSVLNPPGSGVMEQCEFDEILPQISQALHGRDLLIPSASAEDLTASTAPVWYKNQLWSLPIKVRFFCHYDGNEYRVLPGGIAQYALPLTEKGAEFQKGYKDIWVISQEVPNNEKDPVSLMQKRPRVKRSAGLLSSRAADDLYWLGRYSARSEFATRFVLEATLNVTEEEQRADLHAIRILLQLLEEHQFFSENTSEISTITSDYSLLLETLKKTFYAGQVDQTGSQDSIPNSLKNMSRLSAVSRSRLSNELTRIIYKLEEMTLSAQARDFTEFKRTLRSTVLYFSAFNGNCLSNLTRTSGWHFIAIGQCIESASWLIGLIDELLKLGEDEMSSFMESVLSINDTTLTYRFRYQASPHLVGVLDLIMFDPSNPRSLFTLLMKMKESLERLLPVDNEFPKPVVLLVQRALHFLETEFIDTTDEQTIESSLESVRKFVSSFHEELPSISENLGWEFFTHVDYRSL